MKCITAILIFGLGLCHAQNTLQLAEGQTPPNASMENVSWIQGHWKGEAFGGVAEEIWSPPMGGTMMFVFRLVHDQKVSFYEIGHIKEVGGTLLMQLKHFSGDLVGWEEKEETVDFKLVKIEADRVFFEGLTFERITDGHIRCHVLVEDGDTANEVLFDYKKAN